MYPGTGAGQDSFGNGGPGHHRRSRGKCRDPGERAVDALMSHRAYDQFSQTSSCSVSRGLGFCPRGEAGRFVEGGRFESTARLPTKHRRGTSSNFVHARGMGR